MEMKNWENISDRNSGCFNALVIWMPLENYDGKIINLTALKTTFLLLLEHVNGNYVW